MGDIWLLVLAAGSGTRMRGGDKLLEEVDGVPQIRRAAEAGLAAGLPVIVAVPRPGGVRATALSGVPVRVVEVADADEGMGASLRAAVAAVPEDAAAAMVLPGDMPEIGSEELATMAAAFSGEEVLRGASGATPGHPVLFPRRLFPALHALQGDRGAREVLKGEVVRLVELPGTAALTDLDTPEAWAAWRKGQS